MTTTRPSFSLMTAFVIAAAGLYALAAAPVLQIATSVAI